MLKFDNTHVFTGYIKQLLSSFNLPTCRIYTRDFAKYRKQHGEEDPRVLESFDTLISDKGNKKRVAYRATYLKGNELFNYFLSGSANKTQKLSRSGSFWKPASAASYDKDKFTPGLTRTLYNPGNNYNTDTHEYLGEYLRFLRDYYNVDLMSMYNCFNNSICNNLHYNIYYQGERIRNNVEQPHAVFDSRDLQYRIYAFPVKLFSDYTIAIDCGQEVEMFCGFYNKIIDDSAKNADLSTRTYKRVNRTLFSQPFLYDCLNVKYWSFEQGTAINEGGYPTLLSQDTITRWDIANREQDLKLFIKVPASCKSSIVVLEGDYRNYNNFQYAPAKARSNSASVRNSLVGSKTVWEYKQNHSVLNFDNKTALNESAFKPIGRLQLLAFNTGESYPFADRLIEYLSGSVITSMDDIADNIKRAQKVMSDNNHHFKIEGLWEDKMQKIIYDYLVNSGPVEVDKSSKKLIDQRHGYHPRLGHNSKSMLYDTIGYIDKEAEKWYASWVLDKNTNHAKIQNSIQNVDIYNGLFDI